MKEKTLAKGWREVRLGEICTFQKGKGLSKKEIRSNGKCPCILYGELFTKYSGRIKAVISRTDNIRGKFLSKRGDILMPSSDVTPNGLATASVLYEDGIILGGDIIVIRSTKGEMDSLFFSFYVKANKQAILKLASGTTVFHIYKSDLSRLKIPLPPLPEQRTIAALLETWDTAIEKTETLIAAKQRQFEWLVASLINKAKHKMARLLDFVEEISIRNQHNNLTRVLSVTNHSGFVLPEKQFERRIASADVSNYKIVKRGQYAYNPARINVGSIARLDNWDNGIISPMYTVFKLNQEKIENDYFLYWLSSNEAKQRIRNNEQGGVRKTVSLDSLSSIPIALPNIRTQRAITKTLNTSQQEITLLEQLAERYRAQKHALMQKLLTGKWRTQA